MPSKNLETIFKRDLDRLDGLAHHEWLPVTRVSRPRVTGAGVATIVAIAVAVLVVALSALAVRDGQVTQENNAAASNPYVIVGSPSAADVSPGASPVAGPSGWLTEAPSCPSGQVLGLRLTFPPPPGDVPGTGATGPEEAFRRKYPSVTEFKTFPMEKGQRDGAPVWIVAGDQTYVANRIGSASNLSWFVYPATVIGCRTPTEWRGEPPPPAGTPVG